MLVAEDGAVCYIDFENPSDFPSRGFISLFDSKYQGPLSPKPAAGSSQVVIVSNGIVKSRGEAAPANIVKGDYVVWARFNDWLDAHAVPGSRLQIKTAAPFRPDSHTHQLDIIDGTITEQLNMACYTPSFGKRTPNTVFRREAIVSRGRIIRLGGGSSIIPADGFVLSGWGMSALWISHWGLVGAKVSIDNNKVTIIVDEEAWFRHAEYYMSLLNSRFGSKLRVGTVLPGDQAVRMKTLHNNLVKARSLLRSHPDKSWAMVFRTIADAKKLLYESTSSPPGKVRGVILASVPTGARLQEYITRFESAGINTIVPLVNKYDDLKQLDIVSPQLRSHGIKTIAWMWLPLTPTGKFDAMLQDHPDWADKSLDGSLSTPDPACPEAMKWWCQDTETAFRASKIDALLLDYEGFQGGYSELSRQQFCAKEGIDQSFDPRKLSQLSKDDPVVRKWSAWRRELTVRMVDQLVKAVRRGRPKVHVNACVTAINYMGGDIPVDQTLHMIWPDWVRLKTFDSISTMVYAQDAGWVEKSVKATVKLINGTCPYWPILILYPETGGSMPIEPELLIEEAEGARRAGTNDVLLFLGDQFMPVQGSSGDDLYNCLRYGLFRSSVR
jgi:hypothetical protein